MTQEEILEGNKLIADFMELKYGIKEYLIDNGDEFNYKFEKSYSPFIFTDILPKSNNLKGYKYAKYFEKFDETHNTLLHYHSSWNWLIPVFQKIEKLGYGFAIMQDEVEIFESGYQWITHSLETTINKTLIEAAFICCADFIEQYNNNTLQKRTK